MKLKHTLSMVLLALASLLGLSGRREEVMNEASTAPTHANGIIPLTAEVTITTRYVLVARGAGVGGIILNQAGTRPLGICLDEPTLGSKAAVALLGCSPGTLKIRSGFAVNMGDMLYTSSSGQVINTWSATAFLVGRALNTTSGFPGNDLVEVAHCFPMINAAATL